MVHRDPSCFSSNHLLSGFSAFEVFFSLIQCLPSLSAFSSSLIQAPRPFGSYCLLPISTEKQEVVGVRGGYKRAQDHTHLHHSDDWSPVLLSLLKWKLKVPLTFSCVWSTPPLLQGCWACLPWPSARRFPASLAAVSEFMRLSGKLYPGQGVSGPQRKRRFFTVSS